MGKILSLIVLAIFIFSLVVAEEGYRNNSYSNNTKNNSINRNITSERFVEKIEFSPYQKRNESECLEGCRCIGAVVYCETENGKVLNITAGSSGNNIILTMNRTKVNSNLSIEQEREENRLVLRAKLSNGLNSEIKIMPDVAAERALERLRLRVCSEENNCTIELKETGNENIKRIAYELRGDKNSRLFGLLNARMRVLANVDAETGEVIFSKKPWWAFLATESGE